MKRTIVMLTLAMGMMVGSHTATAQTGKQVAQFNNVMKTLKLDKAQKEKFAPVLRRYYDEMASVKKSHSALKDKHQAADDAGKLTDAQCDMLFNSKFKLDQDELTVKKKYYEEFKKVLSVQQAYKAIRVANDKVK